MSLDDDRRGLRWGIEPTTLRQPVTCFWCERPFEVGIVGYGLRSGPEVVAVMCPDCLCPNARRDLADAAARIRQEHTS
jgi:hypothetical protein